MMIGVATPTEAAAPMSLIALSSARSLPVFNRRGDQTVNSQLLQVTIMILTIIAASAAFSQVLAFSVPAGDAPTRAGAPVDPSDPAIMLARRPLGCFIEQVSS
jgi:TRAP-type mannitol/chloroaromatic compound transport system permease large subunit